MSDPDPRRALLDVYHHALGAVGGRAVVADWLRAHPPAVRTHVVAIGKAAAAMAAGAVDALGDDLAGALVITKYGHLDAVCNDPRVACLEAGHPVPDQASLAAGERLLDHLERLPHDAELLFLISGGTSALVEVLPQGITLEDLGRTSEWLLGSGGDIEAVNRVRKRLSRIKAGRLAARLGGRPALNLMLSDVPGDDPRVIGSGLLVPHEAEALTLPDQLPDWLQALLGRAESAPSPDDPCFDTVAGRILAGNHTAREAAARRARELGLRVHRDDTPFQGEARALGRRYAEHLLRGEAGLYVWGGESTVELPADPGRGGRSQALALAAAEVLAQRQGVALLAAGTDGSDGPTEDAGALVDGGSVARGRDLGLDPADCLRRADAGSFLEAAGDLVRTGPTGTNVMDLVLGLKV